MINLSRSPSHTKYMLGELLLALEHQAEEISDNPVVRDILVQSRLRELRVDLSALAREGWSA